MLVYVVLGRNEIAVILCFVMNSSLFSGFTQDRSSRKCVKRPFYDADLRLGFQNDVLFSSSFVVWRWCCISLAYERMWAHLVQLKTKQTVNQLAPFGPWRKRITVTESLVQLFSSCFRERGRMIRNKPLFMVPKCMSFESCFLGSSNFVEIWVNRIAGNSQWTGASFQHLQPCWNFWTVENFGVSFFRSEKMKQFGRIILWNG